MDFTRQELMVVAAAREIHDGEVVFHSYHPGESIDSVREDTGWTWRVLPEARETPRPTREEVAIIRRYDPQGFWTGRAA